MSCADEFVTHGVGPKPESLFVQVNGHAYPVESIADASRKYSAARDASNAGASDFPGATIVNDKGEFVGRISYNGKVWGKPTRDWKSGDEPIYDPYAEEEIID